MRHDKNIAKAANAVARTLKTQWPEVFVEWETGNLASWFYDGIYRAIKPPKPKKQARQTTRDDVNTS